MHMVRPAVNSQFLNWIAPVRTDDVQLWIGFQDCIRRWSTGAPIAAGSHGRSWRRADGVNRASVYRRGLIHHFYPDADVRFRNRQASIVELAETDRLPLDEEDPPPGWLPSLLNREEDGGDQSCVGTVEERDGVRSEFRDCSSVAHALRTTPSEATSLNERIAS